MAGGDARRGATPEPVARRWWRELVTASRECGLIARVLDAAAALAKWRGGGCPEGGRFYNRADAPLGMIGTALRGYRWSGGT